MVIPPDRPDRLDAEKSLAALSACVANAVGFPLAIGPVGECKVSYPEKLCGRKGHQCPLWVKSRHVQRTSSCPLSANSGHYVCLRLLRAIYFIRLRIFSRTAGLYCAIRKISSYSSTDKP